jgi:NAD(P)H-dependent FMN reductase
MENINILGIAGSLRKNSYNRAALRAAKSLTPDNAMIDIFELDGIPGFNEDEEQNPPEKVVELKTRIQAADAILFVTAEYNYSIPGVLKNAIDWASRPRGASAIAGTPAAVLAASGSPRAAQWAREDAVRVLTVAGADVIEDTVGVGSAFDAFVDGRLSDEALDTALRGLVTRLTHEVAAARAA